jgi:hypothetical protein
MIFNGVDLRILNVWPICSNGLVVSLVCGVAMLEGAVVRGQALLQCFLFKE